jgi:polyvinyl alcohol dehydrogenase (cytochrome)
MRQFTPERVLTALTTGPMVQFATRFSDEEKRALAEAVTGKPFGGSAARSAAAMKNRCSRPLTLSNPWTTPRWNGWAPDVATQARFQPADAAGLTASQVPQLRVKWAFGIPGAGSASWSQPTVVGGAVFVGSDNNFVYALDAKSGCAYWSFEAKAGVRGAVTIGDVKDVAGVRYAAYFGDWMGYVYGLDAETGTQIWIMRADDHPSAKITGAPVLDAATGRLIVPIVSWEEVPGVEASYPCCTFQGSVVALDGKTGRQLWKTYTIPERARPLRKNAAGTQLYGPAGSGIWMAPTIDPKRGVVYVGTGNSSIDAPDAGTSDAVMAFDLNTGRRLWWTQLTANDNRRGGCGRTDAERRINCPGQRQEPNDDVSGSPVLVTLPNGRRALLVGQESSKITAVDPDRNGAVLWVTQAGDALTPNAAAWGGASDGELYYRPLPFSDGTGAMAALRVTNGDRVWYTKIPRPGNCADNPRCSAGLNTAPTIIPGVVFAGGRDGVLRGFATADGRILWEYATQREFETVNGVPGKGGGFGAGGPSIVNGMLFAGSGYYLGTGGNVLLAFGVE